MCMNKKIMGLALSFALVSGFSSNASFAMEKNVESDEIEYLIVNGSEIVYAGQDYENPETGEYIRWHEDEKSERKSFSFRIQHSVSSSSFTPGKTSVSVKSSASVQDRYGKVQSGYKGHKYQVSLVTGLSSKTLKFQVSGTESGTITGLSKDKSYQIRIINTDSVGSNYLVGEGSVN